MERDRSHDRGARDRCRCHADRQCAVSAVICGNDRAPVAGAGFSRFRSAVTLIMPIKEAHFTPQRMLAMLGLKADSFGSHALIPGPKERSDGILKLLKDPQKNFTFLDYEMHPGFLDGKRVTVGNRGRHA